MKILLIDDEKDILEMVSKALKRNGYEVTAVASIPEAAKQIRYHQWDLIISDVMIPYEGGFELVESIKASSNTPVIMITGMSEDILNATINKADAILHKPFSSADLIKKVKELTANSASSESVTN
jgi:DNA-binding response OmpR family regulator